jgi:hypothetical protein
MAEQSWLNGAAPGGEGSSSFFAQEPTAPPPVARRSSYELRPLTTGEVLDRTFFLYRNNFWLFVGLGAIAAAVSTVTSILRLLYLHFSKAGPVPATFTPVAIGMGVVSSLLYLGVYCVTQAATVSAVTSIYLGDATSMKQAFQAVAGRWYRFLAIALWQAWSAMWLSLVLLVPAFAGIAMLRGRGASAAGAMAGLGILMFVGVLGGTVYGLIAYIRNSLAVAAEVMEGLSIRAAMRRSKSLAAGTKGRIFLLLLFLFVLYMVVGGIELPFGFLIVKAKVSQAFLLQAVLLFVNFLVASAIAPVGAIGLCLFYIDQRVRKEGFDIEFLIERSGPVPQLSYPAGDSSVELP